MTWLDLIFPVIAGTAFSSGVILIVNLFKPEGKRLGRIVRAEIHSRMPGRFKRPTIDIAVLTGQDVSLKWWDEEFAKLNRTSVSSSWERWANHTSNVMVAPTPTELNGMARAGVTSYAEGGLTFYVSRAMEEYQEISHEIVQQEAKLAKKHGAALDEECEFCDYVHSYSYGSVTGKRYKTEECWECRNTGPKGPDGPKGPIAEKIWTPDRYTHWYIS